MKRKLSSSIVVVAALGVTGGAMAPVPGEEDLMKEERRASPIKIELTVREGFASFANAEHPGNRIGYRFHEHVPLVLETDPTTPEQARVAEKESDEALKQFSTKPGLVVYEQEIRGERKWLDQTWTFHLAPVQDGIEMLWVVETEESELPFYYGVQQCFRMSGKSNQDWRREIAETPAFSEYDLWRSQEDSVQKTSLSWVLRGGQWQALPAVQDCVGSRTPLGVRIDDGRFQGSPPDAIGPYKAIVLDPVDGGLSTRADVTGRWVSGLFWERTSHLTNHHPADCLHAIVNVGGIPPGSRRVIRGKIYWLEGSLDDLLEHWREDFAGSSLE